MPLHVYKLVAFTAGLVLSLRVASQAQHNLSINLGCTRCVLASASGESWLACQPVSTRSWNTPFQEFLLSVPQCTSTFPHHNRHSPVEWASCWMNDNISQSIDHPMNHSINKSITQTIHHTANLTIPELIYPSHNTKIYP